MAKPEEPTTRKIWILVKQGFNSATLRDAAEFLGEIPWTTTVVEQGHCSSAHIHKTHRDYATEMLAARAHLHMVRTLFR